MREARSIKEISFCIPGTPVGKARPRVTRSGHAYTPQKTKDYEMLVRSCYESQVGSFQFGAKKPLEVLIEAEFPIPKSASKKRAAEMVETYHTNKPDADNLAKGILDALNGVAFPDDSAVSALCVVKTWSNDPCTYVSIREIPWLKRLLNKWLLKGGDG